MTPSKEPVVWSNVASAIMAILGALVALGIINLLPPQMEAIEAAIGAVLLIAGPTISTMLARSNSTPLAEPKDVDGERLVRENGSMPIKVAERAAIATERSRV